VNSEDEALVALGRALRSSGYRFAPVSAASHRRVVGRPGTSEATSFRDVFGWNRPFERRLLSSDWLELLGSANVLEQEGQMYRSSVRFSTVGDGIFAHSSFPATAPESVDLGPDAVRFVSILRRSAIRSERAVEVGCGAGAIGISIAPWVRQLVLADIQPRALRYARVNAQLNGVSRVELAHSDILADVSGSVDLVIACPPHGVGGDHREGGGSLGIDLAVRIVKESLERLVPGGRVILYTATPIRHGEDAFAQAVQPVLAAYDTTYEYMELDPDADSEELEKPQYAQVERIARVGLSAVLPGR
jgi:hypothetical protein